jgi:uncharacterized protein (DUF1015 family)
MKAKDTLRQNALAVPDILLPSDMSNLSRWSVIACDQFTQDRDYWKKTREFVAGSPSTLDIILPEVYLEDGDRAERLASIRSTMKSWLSQGGVFAKPVSGFVYIERATAYGRTRKGLVAAIDLDAYDWKPGSKAPIRATEATIVERIPPRMEIRRGAPVESPHIMLLVNDSAHTLVEGIGDRVRAGKPLYQTELMHGSGSITGWRVESEADLAYCADAVSELARAGTEADGSTFLFAVGDGNHSLATAKAVWDEFRASNADAAKAGTIDLENHSVRFALAELVNLYDDGLTFEPIHRVLFGTTAGAVTAWLKKSLGGSAYPVASAAELEKKVAEKNETRFGFVAGGACSILDTPDPALAVSRLQPALDAFLKENPGVRIDYIHGSEEVFRLGNGPDAVAILLPPVEKDSFFATIAAGGPLPRKSFSMGEASEKRFYLECRALF